MKRREVVFSPEARRDLLQLYDWIEERAGGDVALRYVERLASHCRTFEVSSQRGRRRDDIQPGLRITGFERRVTIALVVEADTVIILRLYYGGQDWD